MSIRSQIFRAFSILCLVLIAVGPVPVISGDDNSKPNIKPISQNNRSSQSSRYGTRVQQMQSRSSSSSASRSSSVTRTSPSRSQSSTSSRSSSSYRPSSRSSSSSTPSSRSSSSYSPSSRSSSSSSAVNRSQTSRSSSYDRSRSSSPSSLDRSRSSSSSYSRTPSRSSSTYSRSSSSNRSGAYSRNTTPSRSSSYSRSTSPSNSSSYDRNRRSGSSSALDRYRSTTPSTNYTRGRTNTNTSTYDRSRGTTNPYVRSNDRSSTLDSRTRSGSVVTPNNYDRTRSGSTATNRNDRRDVTGTPRGDINRGSSSTQYNRDQRMSGRSASRQDNTYTSYDRNRSGGSHDRYSYSRNSNRDRDKHFYGGYHNRYVFDYHRYKDWRYYRKDKYLYGAYCPFYDRLYHYSYFNRRYYSPSVFSTVILGAGVTHSIYDNYDYGNYTTYKSTEPFVELYEHSRFRGESLQVFAGEAIYNLRDIRFGSYKSFNDRFSSIKVYGEVTVILYIDSDFGGDYIYLHGSHIDFTRDPYLRRFNDRVSSIEVIPGIVNEADHRAGSRDYMLNSHLLDAAPYQPPVSSTGFADPGVVNTVAEVPVAPSVNNGIQSNAARVILYDQPNYKGNQIILTPGDVHVDLMTLSKGLAGTWNDCVASIRVEGSTELFIYCDREFRGDGIAIRYDVPNMAVDPNLVPFVNRVSSVVVNPAY